MDISRRKQQILARIRGLRLRPQPELLQAAGPAVLWEAVRSTFFVAEAARSYHELGSAAIAALRATGEDGTTLRAYEGAFQAIQARHLLWPLDQLNTVRAGVATLTAAAEADPANLEAAFLCASVLHNLPAFLAERARARAAISCVLHQLDQLPALPPFYQREVLYFLLAHAALTPEHKSRLRESVRSLETA